MRYSTLLVVIITITIISQDLILNHHHHHHHQVSVTSLLTSLSLAHLAPRLLLNGFDTVPRLQNLSTEDLNFLEVKGKIRSC